MKPVWEGTDLDPGPAGRDRGNLQKGVFVIKRETASAKTASQ